MPERFMRTAKRGARLHAAGVDDDACDTRIVYCLTDAIEEGGCVRSRDTLPTPGADRFTRLS